MIEQTISVTEAARSFADCVNRVYYQGATFVLLRNGTRVARLAPDYEKRCLGRDLAAALEGVALSRNEAKAWRRDWRAARKTLTAPVNRWR
jgi:antitoxin (DNA-binding transcriptional repressor) of toxin-antitoxin stability system